MPPHKTYIETHLGDGAIMQRNAAATEQECRDTLLTCGTRRQKIVVPAVCQRFGCACSSTSPLRTDAEL
jgi:hypothetical protein